MSLSQYSSAFNSTKSEDKPSPDNLHYHFVYDFPQTYKDLFPNQEHSVVGRISNWEFHVNQLGKANIRPTFDIKQDGSKPYGENYLLPRPGLKDKHALSRESYPVYGIVFAVNRKDDKIVEKHYAQPQHNQYRVRCNALLDSDGIRLQREVSVFVDLYHTCNGFNENHIKSQKDYDDWRTSLDIFRKMGVPEGYLRFLKAEVWGLAVSRISPIHVDPEAYLSDNIPQEPVKVCERPAHEIAFELAGGYANIPRRAAFLQEIYYGKYGKLAPACPTNRRQARKFDEYHDEILRGQAAQAKVEGRSEAHLEAMGSYAMRISNRCDDGLDVYDAIRESRGQPPWKHPNTVGGPEERVKKGVAAAQPQAAFEITNQSATPVSKRKRRPANLVMDHANAASPAKKRKVQQSSPPAGGSFQKPIHL